MSALRKGFSYTAAVAALITGYAFWRSLGPGEQRNRELLKRHSEMARVRRNSRWREIAKNLPESNPARMEESRRRNAQIMELLKDAAQTNDNIARTYGSQK